MHSPRSGTGEAAKELQLSERKSSRKLVCVTAVASRAGGTTWRICPGHQKISLRGKKEVSEIGIDPARQIESVRGGSNNRALRTGSHNPIIEAD